MQDYTKDKTIKELRSAVEKAGSDELAKKAEWMLAQSMLKRVGAAGKKAGAKQPAGGILSILDRAFSLDEKIRAELALLQKNTDFDAVRGKAARDLTGQLEMGIAEAEADQAAARVDRLKTAIHEAAARYGRSTPRAPAGVKPDAPVPAEGAAFVAGIGERMTPCHERIARLSNIVLEAIRDAEPRGFDLDSLTSKIQAAEAGVKSAGLTREIAELQMKEYLEAAVPQKQAMHERELGEAKDDLNRAMKQRVRAIERCAKIKELSKNSASDLELEDRFEEGRVASELEQQRAEIAIDLAKSKLLVLKTFTKHQRTTELKSQIERARSNELAVKAELTLAEAQLRRARGAGRELSEPEKKLLGLLDQALAVDQGIRAKLEKLRKNGRTRRGTTEGNHGIDESTGGSGGTSGSRGRACAV